LAERYGRARFKQDAVSLGLSPEEAKSTIVLRRRRDQLMSQHHPDRGGDVDKAARINAIYARMTRYLNARKARRRPVAGEAVERGVFRETLKANLHAGAAQFSALALAAVAGLALLQKFRKR
jgi:hypothetical protein